MKNDNPYAGLIFAIGNARFAAEQANLAADRINEVESGCADEETGKALALERIADAIAALERARAGINAR